MDKNNNVELWDAYFEDGSLAGRDLVRGKNIPEGLMHVVADVFVMHEDGSILLMQRDFNKDFYPGLFESGAGGSVIKGETPEEGAKRELFEETGIVAVRELKEHYNIVNKGNKTIYRGYLYITDVPKESVRLQEGETVSFKWVDKDEFKKIFYSDQFVDVLRNRLIDFVEQGFRI